MIIRNLTVDDIPILRTMTDPSEPEVEVITDFTWMVVHRYFRNLCFVAEVNGEIVGFVTAIRGSADINVVYLWQIRVLPAFRKQGIASRLIMSLIKKLKDIEVAYFEVSIDPSNIKSLSLFKKTADFLDKQLIKVGEIVYSESFSNKPQLENVYRINLLDLNQLL